MDENSKQDGTWQLGESERVIPEPGKTAEQPGSPPPLTEERVREIAREAAQQVLAEAFKTINDGWANAGLMSGLNIDLSAFESSIESIFGIKRKTE
ncbi:hypothetical protein [Zobellella sp. DQSA1]|uniref:hypothetical protein n=1 Tax=Zobellella sp. DQSA1 TaxID=3342386 RepID=UPI0035C06C2B